MDYPPWQQTHRRARSQRHPDPEARSRLLKLSRPPQKKSLSPEALIYSVYPYSPTHWFKKLNGYRRYAWVTRLSQQVTCRFAPRQQISAFPEGEILPAVVFTFFRHELEWQRE